MSIVEVIEKKKQFNQKHLFLSKFAGQRGECCSYKAPVILIVLSRF